MLKMLRQLPNRGVSDTLAKRPKGSRKVDHDNPANYLGEKPTVRALQEHFGKLKKDAAACGAGVDTPKKSQTSNGPIRSLPTTPAKRTAPKSSSTSKSKRARKGESDSEEATISRQEADDLKEASGTPTGSLSRSGRVRRAASENVRALIQKAYASDSNEDDEDDQEDSDEDGEYREDEEETTLDEADESDTQVVKTEAVQENADIKREPGIADEEI